jgi:TM2 domain-containing membrane protein YozV
MPVVAPRRWTYIMGDNCEKSDRTMSHQQSAPGSGKHSTEPEIIPPSAGARLRDSDAMWVSFNERGTHRIYVTRLGPFSLVLLALGIGLLAALVFVLAIGTFLIWISLVALLVTATILSTLLRQRFRHWH